MRSTPPNMRLVKSLANRFAAEALKGFELTPIDLAEEPLTAEERVAIYAEIRAISDRLLQESERLHSLV